MLLSDICTADTNLSISVGFGWVLGEGKAHYVWLMQIFHKDEFIFRLCASLPHRSGFLAVLVKGRPPHFVFVILSCNDGTAINQRLGLAGC